MAAIHRRCVVLGSEVAKALKGTGPSSPAATNMANLAASKLVVLESAILTHGMPYPENFHMAKRVQEIIRENGAVPATVGVLAGKVHVGMGDQDLRILCQPGQRKQLKISRRDLSAAIVEKVDGGTTVSGTLAVLRSQFEAPIFVTGGVGGVHRGGESSMDVSADLVEMGSTPTMVVSSGAKSILDIGKTLEVLETFGVCVATLGVESREFPSFFSRRSGFHAPHNVESVADAAELLFQHRKFGLDSGILLAVPIPESAETDGKAIEDVIQEALLEAEELGVAGRDVTPFVLQRVSDLSGGKSLQANLALIENNADVGSRIAVELSKLYEDSSVKSNVHPGGAVRAAARPFVIGGSVVDLVTSFDAEKGLRLDGSTHKGKISCSFGGVGRNLADALARFNLDPIFLSAVGDDHFGRAILDHNQKLAKDNILIAEDAPTAVYNLILDGAGEIRLGVGDMDIHARIDANAISSKAEHFLQSSSAILFDGNLSEEAIARLLEITHPSKVPVFFEPTDVQKAARVGVTDFLSSITYASPNLNELLSMSGTSMPSRVNLTLDQVLHKCIDASKVLLEAMQVIIVTLGSNGVLIIRRGSPNDPLPTTNDNQLRRDGSFGVSATFYSVHEIGKDHKVICASGAGDCFVAAFVAALLTGSPEQDRVVGAALQAAAFSIKDFLAVPATLDTNQIDWQLRARGRRIV